MCATIKVSTINSINFLCSTVHVYIYIYSRRGRWANFWMQRIKHLNLRENFPYLLSLNIGTHCHACNFFNRCLIHPTYLEGWSTFWPGTEITWPSTCQNTRTSNRCGTSGQVRGQSSWNSHRLKTSRGPGSTTGWSETGLTPSRVRERSFCTSLCRSRTSGFPWGTSLLIKRMPDLLIKRMPDIIEVVIHCC